ncbi:MAG: winged helix-turn-helix domain-containing protein, partial [Elusimicrobiales bacterium]|nr:winged helix-turn-helix domain-containing protein [Elusimicrobiales bacterium]
EEAVKKLSSLLSSRVLLVITEAGEVPERVVRLLELGAHDVVQKPVRPRILAEQIKALVRVFSRKIVRGKKIYSSPGAAIVMDYPRRNCSLKESGGARRTLRLTKAEFRVLLLLLQKNGAVATYEDFRDAIWPDAASSREISHVLHQLVTNIRRKITGSPVRIENLRAEGFRLSQYEHQI